MLDRRWVQSAGVAGILFVVLLVIGFVLSGNSPDSTNTTAKMVSYITSNRGAVLASQAVSGVASVVLLWFAGVLTYLFRSTDERSPLGFIVLVAGGATATLGAVSVLPTTALAFVAGQPGGLDASPATRVLYELGNSVTFSALNLTFAVFLAALGLAMLRRVFAARWLGWLSIAIAVVNLVAGILGLSTDNSVAGLFALASVIGFNIVTLATSIYLLRYRPAAVA